MPPTKQENEEQPPEMLKPAQYPGPESEPVALRGKDKEAYGLARITQVKAAKNVIAPFLKRIRKVSKVPDITEKQSELTRIKAVSYLTERVSLTIKVLQTYTTAEDIHLPDSLYETVDVLKNSTCSSGAAVYVVDAIAGEIYLCPRYVQSTRHKVNWPIKEESTVACYVAITKKFVWSGDVLADPRFPGGVGWSGLLSDVKAVICVPILSPENEIIAIMELSRVGNLSNYSREDVQIVVAISAWIGAGVYQNQLRVTLLSQQQLNSRLLEFINLYFSDMNVSDVKILSDVMSYAKQMLQADGCSFYLVDSSSSDLAADWYIPSDEPNNPMFKKKTRIRFKKIRTVPAYVARTGQIANVRDLSEDPRFRDHDKNSREITRTALCAPIMEKSVIAGVILLTNKKNNTYFTSMDEQSFKIFTNYCSLSLRHYHVRKELSEKKHYLTIHREVLIHQMNPCVHDIELLISKKFELQRLKLPKDFSEFSWYPTQDASILTQYLLLMMSNVGSDCLANEPNINRFILAMQKSYRPTCHRNFLHAFVVTHAMYNILIRNKRTFTDLEKDALMIAALSHDVDHRGQDDGYYFVTNHALVTMHKASVLERHHAHVAKILFKKCNMLSSLNEVEFEKYIHEIETNILHTNLVWHLRCRCRLENILNLNKFSWNNNEHRFLVKGIMMICASLISRNKPLPINEKLIFAEHMEIVKQNDENKKQNFVPLIGIDRDLSYIMPEDELKFLDNIVLPANRLLVKILPSTADILESSMKLRESWRELVEFSGKRLWRPEDSLMQSEKL